MRAETDEFKCGCGCGAMLTAGLMSDDDEVHLNIEWSVCSTTKDQAREFARQLLELCGDD